ncbi:2OG-Fe dioxygenase family protein [Streptomyces sp. NPDC126499]|uniref:2OG-Fe dioxygenase family protein n=1 Tax=Streptomyces sp. NPDC126499 TaxID=3155314 RepID=UPI00332F989B
MSDLDLALGLDPSLDFGLEPFIRQLVDPGVCLVPAEVTARRLCADPERWAAFDRHWDDLAPDPYLRSSGTLRLRRYGLIGLSRSGERRPRPHEPFLEPGDGHPLYVGRERHFEPLTDAFAADPLLADILALLAEAASVLADPPEWTVRIHPFRVLATAGRPGAPPPDGVHRAGATLVSSLLVDHGNADGGESTVYHPDGVPLFRTVLDRPGTLLLGDDRRTLHGVSAVRPRAPGRCAHRDVLVITLAEPAPEPRRLSPSPVPVGARARTHRSGAHATAIAGETREDRPSRPDQRRRS